METTKSHETLNWFFGLGVGIGSGLAIAVLILS